MSKRRGYNSVPSRRSKPPTEFTSLSNDKDEVRRHSQKLHDDTKDLIFVCHNIHTYAKKLDKLKTKIERKRGKTNSKQLAKCEVDYDTTFKDLIIEIKQLNKQIPTTDPDDEACAKDKRLPTASQREHDLQRTINEMTIQLREEEKNHEETVKRERQAQTQIEKLEKQLREEKSAKDDAIRRLSEIASSRLRDNNPNIADLSDQFRPTKIGEMVSELYDNEWTDAYDELEKLKGFSDTDIVKRLLNVFVNIYKECKLITTTGFYERIQICIEHSDILKIEHTDVPALPDHLKQQVKEYRKFRASQLLPQVVDSVLRRESLIYLSKQPYETTLIKKYAQKCTSLAWMMCVQDPPLVLSVETNTEFDPALFRDFMKKGPFVEYVTWPVIYLHEGGPVLCKGVAQGTDAVTKL